MALENESMKKKSIEISDRCIVGAIACIRKKSKKRVDEPSVIDYVLNKNNNINVDKQVVQKRIFFLTTNGTLQNKPNSNKNSFRVKDQANSAPDDIIDIDNTPAPPKIFNTLTEVQVTDLLEESVIENGNNNHTLLIDEHDLRDLATAGEQINNLRTEIAALK